MGDIMFFEDLKKKRLRRNDGHFYTLDDPTLDRLFCINTELTLTPNPIHIENFAASNYLYSLFGMKIDAFTAVAAGFVASYVKNNEENDFYGTFFLSDTLYVLNDIIKLCEEKINSEENKEVYVHIKEVLQNKDTSLLEKSILISSYLKQNNITMFDKNINDSFNSYKAVNDQNCKDNHLILEDFTDHEGPMFHTILDEYIIPGYFSYMGHDRERNPLPQMPQILNEYDRINLLMKLLKYDELPSRERTSKLSNIVSVLNMCSTDYTADVVQELFKKVIEYEKIVDESNYKEVVKELEETIPKAPGNDNKRNEAYKNDTRDEFDNIRFHKTI